MKLTELILKEMPMSNSQLTPAEMSTMTDLSAPELGTVIATAIGDEYRWDGETWMLRYRLGFKEFGPWHPVNWRDAVRAVLDAWKADDETH
jgi:hypothetical protein